VSASAKELGPGHRQGRAAVARLPLAAWCAAALQASQGLGCTEQERPNRVADVSVGDARRVLTGSFVVPSPDADAGAGAATGTGGASSCSGAATPCMPSSAGASGSGADVTGGDTTPATGTASDGTRTLRQTYEAVCEDSTVQWGFLTYRATTPGDSSIHFRLRTAPTEDQLTEAEYIDLVTASSALGTERCTFTGPAPCPIDLFVVLGGAPLAHHPLSELEVVLTPASADGNLPTVDEWNLNYSCTLIQ
jgi:hypothetical protein